VAKPDQLEEEEGYEPSLVAREQARRAFKKVWEFKNRRAKKQEGEDKGGQRGFFLGVKKKEEVGATRTSTAIPD